MDTIQKKINKNQTLVNWQKSTENTNTNEVSIVSTPLHELVSEDKPSVVKLLIQNDSLNEQDENGDTPLHIAAQNNNYEIAKLILDAQPDDLTIKNNQGKTALELFTNKESDDYKLIEKNK